MRANKKQITTTILLLTLILILSTITYAKPFTDAFRGGLVEINNFFTGEQYKPYAKAIDFFFFSLLFISIYMMGARYAFKEVKKPEQVIVILLGLMTAFLLVLGGFSAVVLLPYLHWLLYTLLFILYWWLLKGIKSKFWRFILALLLTLLTIGLIQGLFGALSPDTEGFFKSLARSIGTIQFPEIGVPGVPPALRDLFGAPAAPTLPSVTTLPTTTTPTAEAPGKGGIFGTGVSWWWLALIPLIAAGIWKRKGIAGLFGRGGRRAETTVINEINEMINKKTTKMNEVKQANEDKNLMIQAGESRRAIIERLEDPAYAWEAVRSIQEGHPLKDLYNKELQLINKLKELIDLEKTDFLDSKLNNWQERVLRETGKDITQQVNEFRVLITTKTSIRDIRNMGILWLIAICYDFEKREIVLSKELDQLLREHNVDELIRDKFAKVKEDNRKLHQYNSIEVGIINKLLNQKIELQKNMLEELKRIVTEGRPAQPPAPEAPTVRPSIQITSPPNNTTLTLDPGTNQKSVTFEAQISNLEISLQRQYNYQWVWTNGEEGARDLLEWRLVSGRTTRFRILKTSTATSVNIRDEIEIPVGDHFIIIWLLDPNNKPLYISENYIKITIQPPEAPPTAAPGTPRAPTLPIQPSMRINLMEAVKKERTLLKRMSDSFKRMMRRAPLKIRREIEEAAVEAEEAAQELAEFEKKGFFERKLIQLEKSRSINRKVRAIVRFTRIKIKKEGFIKTAKILLKLEEARLRALGEVIEESPAEEVAGGPALRQEEVTPYVPTMRINLIKDLIREKKSLLQRIKNDLDSAIGEGAPDLSMEDLMLAERAIGPVWEQLELFDKEEIYSRRPVELKERLRNVQIFVHNFAQFIKSRIPKLRKEAEQLELNFDRVTE